MLDFVSQDRYSLVGSLTIWPLLCGAVFSSAEVFFYGGRGRATTPHFCETKPVGFRLNADGRVVVLRVKPHFGILTTGFVFPGNEGQIDSREKVRRRPLDESRTPAGSLRMMGLGVTATDEGDRE